MEKSRQIVAIISIIFGLDPAHSNGAERAPICKGLQQEYRKIMAETSVMQRTFIGSRAFSRVIPDACKHEAAIIPALANMIRIIESDPAKCGGSQELIDRWKYELIWRTHHSEGCGI